MTLRIEGAPPPAPEPPAPEPAVVGETPEPEGPSAFQRFVAGLGAVVDQGEGVMQGVESGQALRADPGTLIALQAGIYRYSEAVDLAGKLVDRGGNGLRTVLQGGQ
jgi:hypothetical protein